MRRTISEDTWLIWQHLVGACYPQGKRFKNRKYTYEQTRLFLCLAWMRRLKMRNITYQSLRNFHASNNYKIDEVFAALIKGQRAKETEEKLIPLTKVKQCCQEVWGRSLSKDCWWTWRKHLDILGSKSVDEGAAAMLVFIACWRRDNPRNRLPSINRLKVMMSDKSRTAMTLETASSATQFHQWQMHGCSGKDLPRYLAACGFKVSPFTLYSWGGYSQRKFYTVSELAQWRQIAASKRRMNAA
ncbi:hypothetical protein LC593_01990 [Nostoc sp. CHAB 5844]|nr:hypothetical protein [Nostoc sp. CHAB 5844]